MTTNSSTQINKVSMALKLYQPLGMVGIGLFFVGFWLAIDFNPLYWVLAGLLLVAGLVGLFLLSANYNKQYENAKNTPDQAKRTKALARFRLAMLITLGGWAVAASVHYFALETSPLFYIAFGAGVLTMMFGGFSLDHTSNIMTKLAKNAN